MANIYEIADTWDDGGAGTTVFTGIGLNVTDTSSSASSLLMDLQVGGTSKLQVFKNGELRVNNSTGFISAGSSGTSALIFGYQSNITLAPAGVQNGVGLILKSDTGIQWGSSAVNTTKDLILARDAANTLAQRNGTNAQTFNLYNTYTDASNYERGFMRWNSNVLEIGAEAAGTGTARSLRVYASQTKIDGTGGSGFVNFISGNTPQVIIQQSTGLNTLITPLSYVMPESSSPPSAAANKAIIYAEDNGSGKTRLMVQFGTGAAQQIAIEP